MITEGEGTETGELRGEGRSDERRKVKEQKEEREREEEE